MAINNERGMKNMSKKSAKILALMLAVLMTVTLFAGCKGSGDTATETTAPSDNGTTATEATTEAPKNFNGYVFTLANAGDLDPEGRHKGTELGDELNAIYKNIEETYDCLIRFLPAGAQDYDAIYSSAMTGSKLADFYRCRQSTWIPLIVNKALKPLDTTQMAAAGLDVADSDCFHRQFTKLSEFTFDGETHIWAVDVSGKYYSMSFGHTFAVNKTILEAEGYNMDEIYAKVYAMEWTYDCMIDIAESVTKDLNDDGRLDDEDQWGIALDCDGNEIWSNGTGPIVYDAASGKYKANATDPNVITALEYMAKLNQGGKPSPILLSEATLGRGGRRTLFYTGHAAFAGLYGTNFGKDGETKGTAIMTDKVGLLPIPKGPNASNYIMNIVDNDLFVMPISVGTDWEKSAFIMGKIGRAVHDDEEYLSFIEECLLHDEDSIKVFTEHLLPNCHMNITKCSNAMYDITRKGLYHDVYIGSMTSAEAAAEYNPLIQAELDIVFKQA